MNPSHSGALEMPGPKVDDRRDLPATLELHRENEDLLTICLKGDWLMAPDLPGTDAVEKEMDQETCPHTVQFETRELREWNSGLASFVLNCQDLCQRRHLRLLEDALPPGLRKLISLARAVPETTDTGRGAGRRPILERIGTRTLQAWAAGRSTAAFIGENVLAMGRVLRRTAQYRWSDILLTMEQCGPQAIGVVALINFLVGVILAFVGSVQLAQVGASIYVADLVAIGSVREMGCIMTGVILCGRTGAAFAAELGAMKVNEEIDAFKTFAISPLEFLVVPRILALLVMMPLLCVFADLIAILGGFLVSTSMLDITPTEYIRRTIEAITLKSFLLGIFKGGVFGVIVAVTGCLRGMQCGTNAAAVGQATTSAVVTGITAIVAVDGIFAVLCNALGI